MLMLICFSVGQVWAALPENPTWEAKALADIADGSTIIIISNSDAATNIALPSTTTGSNPAKVQCEVATENGVTTITAPEGYSSQDLAWTVSVQESSWKFFQEGSEGVRLFLNGTGSNTALRVGTAQSSNDEFVMGDLGKLLKLNVANVNRFVGPYDNGGSDWRTYNTENATNYKGAALTFYVLITDGGSTSTVATPVIYPADNQFENELEISINCTTEGADIYYTLDGSDPDANATLYENPFTITATTTVKAIAFLSGENSNVATATYTKVEAEPVLLSIDVTGDLVNKSYEAGDNLDFTGLEAKGKYDDSSEKDLTADVLWTFAPALVAGLQEVTVTASLGDVSGNIIISGLEVAEHVIAAGTYDIPINNSLWGTEYTGTTSGIDALSGSAHDVQISISKGTSTTNMYVNDNETRAYGGYSFTISAPAGFNLKSLVFTKGNNWNVNSVTEGSFSGQEWTGVANTVTLGFGGRTDFQAVSVTYDVAAELQSIEISGDLTKKEYEVGENLDFGGLTVTGIYSDETTVDLTSSVDWSFAPALELGVTQVTVTASKGEFSVEKVITGISVKEHEVAAGTYDIPMNNSLWGTAYSGQTSEVAEVTGTAHDVTIKITKGGSNNIYISDGETRAYAGYSMVITAPEGYNITNMVFTKGGSWSCSATEGTLTNQTWTGEANSVSFTFGGRTDFVAVSVTYEEAGSTPVEPLESGYYLIGQNGWDKAALNANLLFQANPENEGEYMLNVTLEENQEIKVVEVASDEIIAWFPDGEGTQYTVNAEHAGEKVVYFKPTYDEAWAEFGGFFYIDENAVVPPASEIKLTFKYYNSTGGDGGKVTEIATIFDDACQDQIKEVTTSSDVYLGRIYDEGEEQIKSNLKFGSSSKAGHLAFELANPTEVEKIIFRASMYGTNEGAEGFTVNGSETFTLSGGKLVFADYEWKPEGVVSSIDIEQVKASNGRFYLTSITIVPKGGTPADTYTVAGGLSEDGGIDDPVFGTAWDPTLTANDMTLDATSGLYVWTKENVELEAGQVFFKVVLNHDWTEGAWPEENWVLSINEAGIYNIEITFNADTKEINAEAVLAPTPKSLSLMGSWDEWSDGIAFTLDATEETAVTILTVGEAKDYEFKLVDQDNNYFGNSEEFSREVSQHDGIAVVPGEDNNMVLHADRAGAYTFTWTYATGTLAIEFPAQPIPAEGNLIYLWDGIGSTTEATEIGGLAEAVQTSGSNIIVGASQKGNYCFKVNKGFSNGEYYVGIELEKAVNAGDSVVIACFRTTDNACVLGIDFNSDKASASTQYQVLRDNSFILSSNGAPDSMLIIVPEGVENAKFLRIYRNSGQTGLWVAKVRVAKLAGPSYPKYFLKNNWGKATEEWIETTRAESGVYWSGEVTYGGNGVWYNTVASDEGAVKVEQSAISLISEPNGMKRAKAAAGIAPYDTVQLVLDPEADPISISAKMLRKDVATYTIMGNSLALFYNLWQPYHPYGYTDLKKQDDGTYTYEPDSKVTLPQGNLEFQIVQDHDPAIGVWPAEPYVYPIQRGGAYNITFTFNRATEEISVDTVFLYPVNIQTLDLKGDWDSWAGSDPLLIDEDNAKSVLIKSLPAGDHEFALFNGSDQLGNAQEFSRDNASIRDIVAESGANMVLHADVAGDYMFTFVFKSNQLIITHPSIIPARKIAPLNGEFSVSASKKVNFARGNLQYNYGDNTWFAAEKQYEILSNFNLRLGDPDYEGSVDLLSWSCESSNYGLLPSNVDADFTGNFEEWGELFATDDPNRDWYTLSTTEWNYIMKNRPNASNLWTMATLGPDSILGLILFPDNWTDPAELTIAKGYYDLGDEAGLQANSFTFADWATMEAAGAVFLPAGGSRAGAYGNHMNGTTSTESVNPLTENKWYCWVSNVNEYGYYWLSTPKATNPNNVAYIFLPGLTGDLEHYAAPTVWERERRRGNSVRLVAEVVPPTYTVAGGSTAIFASEWDATDTNFDMTLQADGSYAKTISNIELGVGTYEYKVAEDHMWYVSYPVLEGDLKASFSVDRSAIYDITFIYYPAEAFPDYPLNANCEAVATPVDDLPSAQIKGSWEPWVTPAMTLGDGNATATYTRYLDAGKTYTFTIISNGDKYGKGQEFSESTNSHDNIEKGSGMKLHTNAAGDYTFTWTFATQSLEITFPSSDDVYNVIGSAVVFGVDWAVGNTANEMSLNTDGTYSYEIASVELSADDYQYRVVKNHDWDGSYPEYDNATFPITVSGKYSILFTLDPTNPDHDDAVNAYPTLIEPTETKPTVQMKGSWDEWAGTITLTQDNEYEASWSMKMTQSASEYQFRMLINGNNRSTGGTITESSPTIANIVADAGNNMKLSVPRTGTYIFTWTYATSTLTVTYPGGGTAIDDVDAEAKAMKVLREGNLFIIKGDKIFNAQGMKVK